MILNLQKQIEKIVPIHLNDIFKISLIFSTSVFLLLVLFQPFEYRSYPLFRVFSDSLLSGFLVLIITFVTRTLTPHLIHNKSSDNENTFVTYSITIILDVLMFLLLSFLVNLFFGGFYDKDYIVWFVLTIKYILIFEILLIPLSLFVRRYMLLDSFLRKKNFSVSDNSGFVEQSLINKVLLSSPLEKQQLEILPQDLLMIKSCSNYVEVLYLENEKIRFCLLRNTFTNINDKIKGYPFLFKCHRSYLININQIVKVKGNSRGYKITIDGLSYEVPVSRSKIPLFNSVFYTDKD